MQLFCWIFLLVSAEAFISNPRNSFERLMEEKCNQEEPEFFVNSKAKNKGKISCASHRNYFAQMIFDIEDYHKGTGSINKVIQTFCRKWPQVRECLNLSAKFREPCLSPEEKEVVNTLLNMAETMLSFICDNEAQQTFSFIAKGGLDCFVSKRKAIDECIAPFVEDNTPDTNSTLASMQYLRFTKEKCRDYRHIQTCTVSLLRTCLDPTPANILDSLFNSVWESTPCDQYHLNTFGNFSRTAVDFGTSNNNSAVNITQSQVETIAGVDLSAQETGESIEKKSRNETDDEFDAFGKYVAWQIRKFGNSVTQATAKHRINELLFGLEMELLNTQNHLNCSRL